MVSCVYFLHVSYFFLYSVTVYIVLSLLSLSFVRYVHDFPIVIAAPLCLKLLHNIASRTGRNPDLRVTFVKAGVFFGKGSPEGRRRAGHGPHETQVALPPESPERCFEHMAQQGTDNPPLSTVSDNQQFCSNPCRGKNLTSYGSRADQLEFQNGDYIALRFTEAWGTASYTSTSIDEGILALRDQREQRLVAHARSAGTQFPVKSLFPPSYYFSLVRWIKLSVYTPVDHISLSYFQVQITRPISCSLRLPYLNVQVRMPGPTPFP